ncbi:unnamed protein product [Symbiodinium pilosum]|uniref:TLC domain-containing protein n=1 Tax=Symbiodinium pilosum TaxID=2952 RepID=A0A812XVU1_SYMPI|nr:unnamed protein product [Symbiodinium pilosum]
MWIMVAIYVTWYLGMGEHHVHSMAFINLFHGLSSSLLVYHVVRSRYHIWTTKSPGTMLATDRLNCFLVSTPAVYISFLVGFAVSEDLAWDILINQDYIHYLGLYPRPLSNWRRGVAVSLLMLPQLAHYFLDAFIWKMGPQNPGLREAVMAMGKSDKSKS